MANQCNNTSVGEIIKNGDQILIIERKNYPQAWALPAGHVDEGEDFLTAAIREAEEEIGIMIAANNEKVFTEKVDNPCKRLNGSFHHWEVFRASEWSGELKAGSDAKRYKWADPDELKALAKRTEYFAEKYGIPLHEVGGLTIAIFGADPAKKETDPEWQTEMGLEPVWYYMLKKIGNII